MTARAMLVISLACAGAFAHGGEDHGAPPPPPAAVEGMRSASGVTSAVEVVARWHAQDKGPLLLRILVADFATNAPIEGASVDLELAGPATLKATAAPTKAPGVYEAHLDVDTVGAYVLTATLTGPSLVDIVLITGMELGPPHENEIAVRAPAGTGAKTLLEGALVLLLGLVVVGVVVFVRRRRAAARALTLVVFGLCAMRASAHGGEDHGDAPAATSAPAASGAVTLAKESQFLLGIRTAILSTAPIADRITATGTVGVPPERRVAVVAAQSGRLGTAGGAFPRLGARVKRGQALATLEPTLSAGERVSFGAEVVKAQAAAVAAEARLDAAKKKLERVRASVGVTSATERDEAAVAVANAAAELEAARGSMSAFSGAKGGGAVTLTAPIDGVVADIQASPGEVVEAGRAAFLIVDAREMWVEARVYEDELGKLASGNAKVLVGAYPDKVFDATLLATGQIVDDKTRTVKVVFSINNANDLLRVGQRASVQIGVGGQAEVLTVPDAAVLDIDGRRVVYVHTSAEEFTPREVALGRRDGDQWEVVTGLAAGDRVVVQGAYSLRNAPPMKALASPTHAASKPAAR